MRRLLLLAAPLLGVVAVVAVAAASFGGGGPLRQDAAAHTRPAPRVVRPAPIPTARLEPVPVIKQVYRNNCETAGLSMMLAAAGRNVDQRVLQRRIVRDGPLDPELDANGELAVWGDPDRGYVGRVEGGGVAGGFGVYQGPIRRLAARYGVALRDLSRDDPSVLYERVRKGRPVMAWVGLSEGPYRRWRSPAGKRISVNFGEHTVILTKIEGDYVTVNDSITGTKLTWTKAEFERRWGLLGLRALGL